MKKSLLFAGFCALALSASAQNPFAYGISADGMKVTYTLNNDAQSVKIIVLDNSNEAVAEVPVDGDNLTKGTHEITLPTGDLTPGSQYNFKVSVNGNATEGNTAIFTDLKAGGAHQYWSPYGLACDNDPNSAHFGRLLVTETQANIPAGYFTSNNAGAGLYEYDPQGEPVKNANGTYGYNPLNFSNVKYAGGAASSALHAKKVRITDDGRVFVGVLNTTDNPLYEVNPDNLNEWSPVFTGTIEGTDGSGNILDSEGNMVASPSAAITFNGSGENLKFVNLGCKYGQVFAFGAYTCYEYNLGTSKTISAAPGSSQEVMPLSLQYTISSQSVTLAYDQDGKGLWYVQYRGTPTEAQPAIKHVSWNEEEGWVEDFSNTTYVCRGGGVAYNKDYSMLAIPTANNQLTIFTVGTENGQKTLTEKSVIKTTIRGFNDIAWDYANNIYVCDNGGEYVQEIELAAPDGSFVETPAPSDQKIAVPIQTAVNDVTTAKAVASVRYYNLAGAESAEAFQGVNVVVTTYTDGSKTTTKMVK